MITDKGGKNVTVLLGLQIPDAHRRHRNRLPTLPTPADRPSSSDLRQVGQADPLGFVSGTVMSAMRLTSNCGLDSGEPDPFLFQADRGRVGVPDQVGIERRLGLVQAVKVRGRW